MRHARSTRPTRASAVLATLGALLLLGGITAGPAAADRPQTWPSKAYWYDALKLQQAWKLSTGKGVTVAVVDSGVKASIGDLQGQVLPGHDFTGETSNGWTDAAENGKYGHGTWMAELIAGTGHGAGIVGVAPDAKILPVRDCREHCALTEMAHSIRWAVDHGADIINISQGQAGPCQPDEQSAFTYAYQHHVLVVVAVGNTRGVAVSQPANCTGAIAVGAVNNNFLPYDMESSGPELDFVAPGVNLPATDLNEQFTSLSNGTSDATAMVSGTYALLKAKYPHDSPRDLTTRLLWHVHNGDAVSGFAKRINDKLGYGLPLPYYALSEKTNLKAANPIYDRIDAWMASHQSTGAASTSASSGPSAHPDRGSSSDDSSSHAGLVVALIVGLVVLILVLVVVVLLVVRGNNRNRPRGPMHPMPPPPPYRP